MGCFFERSCNCLFSILALPGGLALLGYGVYLTVKGESDFGTFLIVIGALLAGSVGWGFVGARNRARRDELATPRKTTGNKKRR